MSAVIASLLLASPIGFGAGKGGSLFAIPRSGGLPAPHPYALSPDGGTVVGQFAPGNPFVYRSGSTVRFRPAVTAEDVYTQAVSANGSVIVGRAGRACAFLKGKAVLFPILPEVEDSFAYAVSDDGAHVSGYAESEEETRAFLWTPGQKPRFLPPIDLFERLLPTGIDSTGQTVCGIATDGVETRPFFGTAKSSALLPLPKGMSEGAANGIDRTGKVIVGLVHNGSKTRAAVWINSKATLLANPLKAGVLDAVLAKSVSRDASIIGGSAGETAMVWLRGPIDSKGTVGYRAYPLAEWLRQAGVSTSGWSLESVTAVAATPRRWIVVGFAHFRGREAGFIASVNR